MHKKQFTETEIDLLRGLFQEKETANRAKQKSIRAKMRKIGFYITDFADNMNLSEFEMLVRSWKENPSKDTEESSTKRQCVKEENSHDYERVNETLISNSKKGLAPWVGYNPIVLILGTLPTDVSLKKQAYYQNKSKNSFWKIMHSLWPEDINLDDKEFVMKHHIALWDCLKSAERKGNTDSGFGMIKNPNDINHFLSTHPSIKTIILNGKTDTTDFFYQYFGDIQKRYKIKSLSSTSNNNTHSTFEEKLSEWIFVKQLCDNAHP